MTVYQHRNVEQAVADAFLAIDSHQLDMALYRCAACGATAPCPIANTAANLLSDMGVLAPTHAIATTSLMAMSAVSR